MKSIDTGIAGARFFDLNQRHAVTIRSHHNVGDLPERLHMKLVEPLRELFKDEVRARGLAPDLVNRHPFPGPGLAIRIPGNITREKLDLFQPLSGVA